MISHRPALRTFAENLRVLDAAAADAHAWRSFRDGLGREIVQSVQNAKPLPSSERQKLMASLQHIYQVLYVADRIRKAATQSRQPLPSSLVETAERLLAKPNARSRSPRARSDVEERYAVGARVGWHKLLRRYVGHLNSDGERSDGLDSIPGLQGHVLSQLRGLLVFVEAHAAAIGDHDSSVLLMGPLTECLEAYEAMLPDVGSGP